jgi:hypothetical protein
MSDSSPSTSLPMPTIVVPSTESISILSAQPSPDSIPTSFSAVGETSISLTPTYARTTYKDRVGTLKRNEFGRKEVWQFFHIYNEKNYKQYVFCLLCEKDIYYGLSHATSNLEKHISRHHKDDYKAIMCDRANKRQCIEPSVDGTQGTIKDFVKPCPSYEDCLL